MKLNHRHIHGYRIWYNQAVNYVGIDQDRRLFGDHERIFFFQVISRVERTYILKDFLMWCWTSLNILVHYFKWTALKNFSSNTTIEIYKIINIFADICITIYFRGVLVKVQCQNKNERNTANQKIVSI